MENKLLYHPNKILTTACGPIVDFEAAKLILEDMKTILYKNNGRGLSAPQVGHSLRMFIATLGKDSLQVFINPEIYERSIEKIPTKEGCLSLPKIDMNLTCRYKEIRIRALNETGNEFDFLLDGINAVVVQHEYDHLYGITLFQRVGSAQRQLKKAQYKKKNHYLYAKV